MVRWILTFGLAMILSGPIAAQEPVLKYEARVNPETGEVDLVLIEQDQVDFNQLMSPYGAEFGTEDAQEGDLFYSDMLGSDGVAYFDPTGDLKAVFASPKTIAESQVLLEKLNDGGTLQKTSWFGRPRLPTAEQAQQITKASINAALEIICDANPRPEKMNLDVSLAVMMGLEGKFAIQMEWLPSRDCE